MLALNKVISFLPIVVLLQLSSAQDSSLCETGTSQSPIDIQSDGAVNRFGPRVRFFYDSTPARIVETPQSFELNFEGQGNHIIVSDIEYELASVSFNFPSEHTVDGVQMDGEIQLVHRNDSATVILSAFIDTSLPVTVGSSAGAVFLPGIGFLGGSAAPSNRIGEIIGSALEGNSVVEVNPLTEILDGSPRFTLYHYYEYSGSLTTAPCTEEGVTWMIMRLDSSFVGVSPSDVSLFQSVFGDNTARPVQALNGRQVDSNARQRFIKR